LKDFILSKVKYLKNDILWERLLRANGTICYLCDWKDTNCFYCSKVNDIFQLLQSEFVSLSLSLLWVIVLIFSIQCYFAALVFGTVPTYSFVILVYHSHSIHSSSLSDDPNLIQSLNGHCQISLCPFHQLGPSNLWRETWHCCKCTQVRSHTITQSHNHTNTQTHKHTNTQSHKHTNTQSHKHTITQTHNHTITHKHTNTQTHTHNHTLSLNNRIVHFDICLFFSQWFQMNILWLV
jgi:ABC-type multidrug transport system fused ATPase/permease subunit